MDVLLTLAAVVVVAAVLAVVGYRLLVSGALTVDTGWGRRSRPLGPQTVHVAAPRDAVYDLLAQPYLGRATRALQDKVQVLERGTDMVVAAHRTPVGRGRVTVTVESVRFTATGAHRLPAAARTRATRRRILSPRLRAAGLNPDRVRRRAGHRRMGTRCVVGPAGGQQVGGDRRGQSLVRQDGS